MTNGLAAQNHEAQMCNQCGIVGFLCVKYLKNLSMLIMALLPLVLAVNTRDSGRCNVDVMSMCRIVQL